MQKNLSLVVSLQPSHTYKTWKDPNATLPHIITSLTAYMKDIEKYNESIEKFIPIPYDGSRTVMWSRSRHNNKSVTAYVSTPMVHRDSSLLASSYHSLPLDICIKICYSYKYVMSLDYLVHDFEFMCRKL